MARIGRIIENRDTGKCRNGFLEQLQPLIAKFSGKVCNPSDVAAGTGKAFNQTCLDRIGAGTRHNYGNRLGRILDGLDVYSSSCYHDDINLETHQFGRMLMVPIELPPGRSVLDGDVLSF